MNCGQVQNLLSAYLDSELPGSQMLTIRAHLSICNGCQKELSDLRCVKVTLATLKTHEPREDFAQQIFLKATSQNGDRGMSRKQFGVLVATAAAATVLAFLVFNLSLRNSDKTQLANQQPGFDSSSDRAVTTPDFGGHAPIIPVSR